MQIKVITLRVTDITHTHTHSYALIAQTVIASIYIDKTQIYPFTNIYMYTFTKLQKQAILQSQAILHLYIYKITKASTFTRL